MTEDEHRLVFPEMWLCLACVTEGQMPEDCHIERGDILHHLINKHGYPDDSTWESVTNRLIECGAY